MYGGGSSSSSDPLAGGGAGDRGPRRRPLVKQHTWSPDTERDEAWIRRKRLHRGRAGSRIGRSVTDDDLDELRGCIDLGFGFGFNSPGNDDSAAAAKLCKTIPALDLYYSINRGYGGGGSLSGSSPSASSVDESSSPYSIFSPDDSQDVKKARLKQWAQLVACSVRQRY